MVTGGSIAVKNPETFKRWLNTYGPEKIILGADVKDNMIAVSGWKEDSRLELTTFLTDYTQQGVSKVICTDINRDGMLHGPSTRLYCDIRQQFNDLYIIASGGVSSMDDILELEENDIPAVIFGKALYEGRITLQQLENHIINHH